MTCQELIISIGQIALYKQKIIKDSQGDMDTQDNQLDRLCVLYDMGWYKLLK